MVFTFFSGGRALEYNRPGFLYTWIADYREAGTANTGFASKRKHEPIQVVDDTCIIIVPFSLFVKLGPWRFLWDTGVRLISAPLTKAWPYGRS